jgi:pimeloyl-ACP methyl ester carboxylesterase
MVWLPGAHQGARDFADAGFAQAVRARHAALDLVFVDLELTHVCDRSALEHLRTGLVLPARAAGVALWLGGISLGGLLVLDYAARYPGEIDGLCLLAPYLGSRLLTAEIAQAPGLAAWQPGTLAETDEERRIWRYLKVRSGTPPLYLGFGRQDRFAAAHRLAADTLPPEAVDVIDGSHDWPTWFRLWENFLDSRFT